MGHFGNFGSFLGQFGQFWVIFGLFWVILGHFWAIFWCYFFVAKYASVLFKSLIATVGTPGDDGDGGDLVETSSFVVEPDGEAGKPVTGAFTPDC